MFSDLLSDQTTELLKIKPDTYVFLGLLAIAWLSTSFLLASVIAWILQLFVPRTPRQKLLVRESGERFLLIHWGALAAVLPGVSFQDRKTDVAIESFDEDGVRIGHSVATVRGTNSKKYALEASGQDAPIPILGLPDIAATALGLQIGDEASIALLSIHVTERFPLEKLWNHSDQSISIGFRVTMLVTLLTTVIAIAISIVFEYWLCRECVAAWWSN